MTNNKFVVPAFLNNDKSSKVKAVNVANDETIRKFMGEDNNNVDCGLDPDELIFWVLKGEFSNERS